ncbi:MAG: TRAP transporter small permease [Desulfobacteraceae bacterium]|jgi:TRAP-type C4-dicarboxylate transport system permease small subunit|nr:TRAP transporter small permease [Desulfobacteraceae bacterium]
MNLLETVSRKIARTFYIVGGTAIVAMMLLTVFDVLMRLCVTLYQRNGWEFLGLFKPIPGTYELVGYLGSVAVAFAMAHTSIKKGHVSVSLLVRLLPPRGQALIGGLTNILALSFFSLIFWRALVYANHLMDSGEVSLTLQLPFYPFVWGIGLGAFAVCLVLVVEIIRNAEKVFDK